MAEALGFEPQIKDLEGVVEITQSPAEFL